MLLGTVHSASAGLALLLHLSNLLLTPCFPSPTLTSMHNVLALGPVSSSSFSPGLTSLYSSKLSPNQATFQEAFPEIPQVEQGDSLWDPCSTWSFLGGSYHIRTVCHGGHRTLPRAWPKEMLESTQ